MMHVHDKWGSLGQEANTWAIKLRSRGGDLKVSTTNRYEFAEAACDAYVLKTNMNSMNSSSWKIESISLVDG